MVPPRHTGPDVSPPEPDSDGDLLSRRDASRIVLGELRESLKYLRHQLEEIQREQVVARGRQETIERRLDGADALRHDFLSVQSEMERLRETAIEARGAAKARGKMAAVVAGLLAAGAALAKIASWVAGAVKVP